MKISIVGMLMLALVCYAIPHTLMDRYLFKYSVPSLLLVWESMIVVISIAVFFFYKFSGEEMVHPELGWPMVIIAIAAVTYYCADFFVMSAYHAKGSIITITSMMIALPVVVGIVKAIIERELPSWRHFVAFAVMGIAVFLFSWAESAQAEVSVSTVIVLDT